MSVVRFISDYHFGHELIKNIRGFIDLPTMNEFIIDTHNSVVNKKDLTYILGDISMHNPNYYRFLDRMNGRKIIILGNHDKPKDVLKLLNHCESVAGMIKYSSKEYGRFFLTHAPMIPANEPEKSKLAGNIHGHVHQNTINNSFNINVSCENLKYIPRTLEELIENKESNIDKIVRF